MNERLIELAQQAGLKKQHGSDREYISDFDWRLFAELIVAECRRVIIEDVNSNPNDEVFNDALDHAQAIIGEHFGVDQ